MRWIHREMHTCVGSQNCRLLYVLIITIESPESCSAWGVFRRHRHGDSGPNCLQRIPDGKMYSIADFRSIPMENPDFLSAAAPKRREKMTEWP